MLELVRNVVGLVLAVVAGTLVRPAEGDLAPPERAAIVDSVANELERGYVIPEKGRELAAKLRERAKSGVYAKFDDGVAFTRALTDDLRADSQDKHLHVDWIRESGPMAEVRQAFGHDEGTERAHWATRNFGYERAERLDGNVGYIEVRGFPRKELARDAVASAMGFVANTDALIIDLRRNGGGTPGGVQLLASYLFDAKPVLLNTMYHRLEDSTEEWWTLEKVDGPRYLDKPVFVLTSERTGSAAEEFAYDVQCPKRATIVGATTAGAGHACVDVKLGEHATLLLPVSRPINPITKTGWEGVGVKPDVETAPDAALQRAHELALERLVAKANDAKRKRELEMALDVVRAKGAAPKPASAR